MARLKFEEEFKLSEARTHMLAYDKLRNFRQSKFTQINAILTLDREQTIRIK